MFRRSRFSVRPNVGTAGRAAATPQDTPSASQEASETLKDTPVTDNKSDVAASEKAPAGDGNDNNRDASTSSAAVQRRKRFAIKPKVAPGRTSTPSRMAKSPVKAVSEKHHEALGTDVDKPTTLRPAPHGLQSPRRRRLSEDTSKHLTMQPKSTSTSSESSGASVLTPAGDSVKQTQQPAESGKQLENVSSSQVKPTLPRPPDKVPPSLPDKESIEISEKAKTLVSKSLLSLTPSAMSLSRLLNDPSDLQRLVKAQKLRELLRQERRKEMKLKKAKSRPKEYTLDPTKMTMRDLIHYLPTSNPMPSSLEESVQEGETVVPPSPEREEVPEEAQEPKDPPEETNTAPTREDEEEQEEQEEALMVPQVRVAEDGSLIIDEESLTVEVQRAKGPNPAYNRDPIFERGSTTTYSSFRKGTYSKPWSSEETDMFFLAISMVGTDFSMICQLFPHRARSEIKNKFKKEERENTWRIDKAFRERRKLDIEYFSKLLEKIMEVQKNKKKLKSLIEKNTTKKRKGKAKGKKKLSDVEEEDDEDENQPDSEKEVEEGGVPAAELKKKRKRKENHDSLTEEGNEKKKTTKKANDQGEAGIPEDAEAALPEDHTNPEMSEKAQNETIAKDTVIKPAKLSRGRAAKPLVPLGRKWGKKTTPATKAKDADKEDESESDGASKEQEIEDSSPLSQTKQKKSAGGDDSSEEEEDVTVKPPEPTRYGRVPKPTKQLNYPAKEDAPSSASVCTPASPGGSPASAKPKPKCTAKRRRISKQQPDPVSKKPKLVTLRASQSESSEEEYEKQWQEEEQQNACSSGKDSTAPVFVPASLDTPQPEMSEVDVSMAELDILASMPDVLGISQDALCPDSTCEQAQRETGTAEPCEHQLDLLVDVIDFLSSEHTEVSEDESYNEAAQTLLTIGNLAHLSQPAQNLMSVQDHITEIPSAGVCETSQLVDEITSKPAAQEESVPVSAGQEVTQTSESDTAVELQGCVPESRDVIKTSEQESDCFIDPTPAAESNSPQVKRGRMSKVKPKPNLSQSSRTALPKSKPEISTVSTVPSQDHATVAAGVEAETVAAAVQVETVAVAIEEETAGEATLRKPDGDTTLLKDDVSCVEVKRREEPTDSQERSADQVEKSAAILDPQNFSEIHSHFFSESQFEPEGEQTLRDTLESTSAKSHVGSAETGFSSPAASQSAVLELEQESHIEESSNKPCVLPAEDVPTHQKGESKVTTDCQSRSSRFQKVKPKPNLLQASRTAKSEPKRPEEKGSTPDPKFHLNEPCDASKPTMDLGAEEPSMHKEKTACVPQVVSDATSVQGTSENQNFPEAQFAESSCKNIVTTATESQAGSIVDVAPVQEESGAFVTPVELPLTQEEGKGASTSQVRRGRAQKVKPKPNVQQTSRTVRSNPQPTQNLTSCPQNLQEIQAEEEMSVNEEKRTRVDQVASEHSANENQNKPEPSPQRVTGKEELSTQQCSPLSCGSTSRPESTDNAKVEEDKKQPPPENSSQIQRTSPVPVLVPSPLHTTALSSTQEEKSDVECGVVSSSEDSGPSVPQRRRRLPKVKPNIRSSTRTTLTETHDIRTASTLTSEQQPEDGVKLTGNAELTSHHPTPVEASPAQPDNRESTNSNPNPDLSEASDVLTVSAIPVCSQKDSSAQSCDNAHSEVTDSPKTSKKACRGRFIKPKPNLGSSSCPMQPKQSTTQAASDSGSCSLHMDGPVVGEPVPGPKCDIQGPAAEATNQALNVAGSCLAEEIKSQSQYNCPSTDPQPSVGYASSLENVTSIAESVLNFPGIFTDMLPEQVPSDPDEPFFILSLTEIPVSPSGEVMNSTAEHPSYPPVTDTSVNPQSRVSGDVSVSCVPEPTYTVLNDMTGPDPAVCLGSSTEGTVDPCWVAKAEPPKSPETEGKNKTENPPTKQRMTATGKQAKQQAKTRTARTKQNRKTLAAEEADSTQTDSTQDSEHPADPPHQDQETVAGGQGSDSSTREQSIRTSGQKRKPKDFPSIHSEMNKTAPSSSPSPAKAAPKGSRVKTKQSQQQTPSVSHTVTPTQPPKEASSVLTSQRDVDLSCLDPTPSTSQTSVSDCVEHSTVNEEEEPTNVSQYFLSDIFTDVEEG